MASRTITVQGPCPGTQTVQGPDPDGPYMGTQGDFQLVVLIKIGDCWHITVYPSSPGSPCAPSFSFIQEPCNPSNPDGSYQASKKPQKGHTASVSA